MDIRICILKERYLIIISNILIKLFPLNSETKSLRIVHNHRNVKMSMSDE